jgi:ABC-2 type transport system ATP-binding protein
VKYALEAVGLDFRYGRTQALSGCSIAISPGRIVGLVGPNGAGKTTLLNLAMGLLTPDAGRIEVLGWSPSREPDLVLGQVGFVAQDCPLYPDFTVAEMLRFGRLLNRRWDQPLVLERLERLDIPLGRRVRQLSGGQRAQVALTLALGKRPELLLLDEPAANLDPLARRAFLTELTAAAADGTGLVVSSHLVADLERICEHVVILSAGRVQLAGDIDELLAAHRLLVAPSDEARAWADDRSVIQASHAGRQSTLLVRRNEGPTPPNWDVRDVPFEDLLLAYLANPSAGSAPAPAVHAGGIS